jgi:hypothetical protein
VKDADAEIERILNMSDEEVIDEAKKEFGKHGWRFEARRVKAIVERAIRNHKLTHESRTPET